MSFRMRAAGSSPRGIDVTEARRALALLADPDPNTICQLFGIPGFQARNRKSPDIDGLVEALGQLPATGAANFYLRFNPLIPGLGPNEVANASHVLRRRWLFVDLDPYKPVEHKDDPATDQEHELTRQAADKIRDLMTEEGWPAPVLVDSGNGWYLLWRVHLPHDKATQTVLRRWLAGLRERVKDLAIIDPHVHDAPRLCKIPGTMACKGTPSDDRPWRPCRLVYVPEVLEEVSYDQIVAATPQDPQELFANGQPRPRPFVLTASSGRAQAYVKKALDNECARVALARPGERNDALNKAAYSLGGYVPLYLTRAEVEGRLRQAARDCGLYEDPDCGERGVEATIQSGLESGMAAPRAVASDRPDETPTPAEEPPPPPEWELFLDAEQIARGATEEILGIPDASSEDGQRRTIQIHTLPQLLSAELPEPSWVVPGLLSEGLNILAGKPKIGKSVMALNMAMTIAAGGMALGAVRTTPGDVLYLALEDKDRRIQSRARKMASAVGYSVSQRLSLATSWPRLYEGGMKLLDLWMKRVELPRLVIIDVWAIFRPMYRHGGSQYEQDYQHLTALKQLVQRRSCTALVLLHCRKGASEDVLEEVSGTMGQTGAADGILVLNRLRSNNEAKVFITGRDVDEQELALQFDKETMTWKSLGPAAQHLTGRLQTAVANYLRRLAPGHAFVNDIAAALDEEAHKIRPTLHRLLEKGLIRRHGNAWAWPGAEGGEADEAVF